jgi:stress-induced-phosphoprotein 1
MQVDEEEPVPDLASDTESTPEKSQEEMDKERKEAEFNSEKEKGNACYKKRQWEEALEHYSKAMALDETNITVYNNKAGTLIELSASPYPNLALSCLFRNGQF